MEVGCDAVPVTVASVEGELLHVPKRLWHPAPQCTVEAPHHPYSEQQSPNPLPAHTYPFAPPHVPSVETLIVDVGRTLVETGVGVLQVPNPDWQPSVVKQ